MGGIYIASKVKHGARWRTLRSRGVPICSTWIDEISPDRTVDWWRSLWMRSIREAAACSVLVCYFESGERFNGALAEVGAALTTDAQVILAGPQEAIVQHSVFHHPMVWRVSPATNRPALPVNGKRSEG